MERFELPILFLAEVLQLLLEFLRKRSVKLHECIFASGVLGRSTLEKIEAEKLQGTQFVIVDGVGKVQLSKELA